MYAAHANGTEHDSAFALNTLQSHAAAAFAAAVAAHKPVETYTPARPPAVPPAPQSVTP